MNLCHKCAIGTLKPVNSQIFNTSRMCINTTQHLCKRKQSKYNPIVRPQWEFGATHRFIRGLNIQQDRYGPLNDSPDYTFLDGRPTPLTPEQLKEKMVRKDIATKIMKGLNKMDSVKQFSTKKIQEIEEERSKGSDFPLKAKS